MNLFEINEVDFFSQNGIQILDSISFKIEQGDVLQVVGKSGSGKSTLLKISAGIIVPTHGNVKFEGKEIYSMNENEIKKFRKRTAFVFQDAALWANQNILQNLSLPLQIHHPDMNSKERLKKIHEICHQLNFEKNLELRPSDLSLGEQKKIALARALVLDPEILFLDEVTESLDIKAVHKVMEILKEFVEAGKTMIYISHNSDFTKAFTSKKIILEKKNEVQN